jgi:hypothetical protein
MPNVVFTVTVGEMATMVTIVASATAIVVGVRIELRAFRKDLGVLSARMDKYETVVTKLFGQIQRLLGALYPNRVVEPINLDLG